MVTEMEGHLRAITAQVGPPDEDAFQRSIVFGVERKSHTNISASNYG